MSPETLNGGSEIRGTFLGSFFRRESYHFAGVYFRGSLVFVSPQIRKHPKLNHVRLRGLGSRV